MIDWDKPVQTRDGREVRIYTRQGRHETATVVGEICSGGLCPPILTRWCADGSDDHSSRPNENDLVNVPQKHTVWENKYKSTLYRTKEDADLAARGNRIACIQVTFYEGDGLSETE